MDRWGHKQANSVVTVRTSLQNFECLILAFLAVTTKFLELTTEKKRNSIKKQDISRQCHLQRTVTSLVNVTCQSFWKQIQPIRLDNLVAFGFIHQPTEDAPWPVWSWIYFTIYDYLYFNRNIQKTWYRYVKLPMNVRIYKMLHSWRLKWSTTYPICYIGGGYIT